MHFSIPDTEEVKDNNHSYVAYKIQVNGSFHCTVRYKQLYNFHEQLKKAFGVNCLPLFPPKKLLPLTPTQTEERRTQLEKYIQIISQDQRIINSDLFNGFFLSAQQETQNAKIEEVILDVFQMNWQCIKVKVYSTDRTDIVLDAVCNALNLMPQSIPYFCIYIVKRDDSHCIPIRRLQNFESPYLSLKTLNSVDNCHSIVVRKSYWDSLYDDDLLNDRVSLNILYFQALNDIEKGLLQANKETRRQLTALQAKGSKKEYLQLARTLKYYGYLQFEPCFCDYPQQNTRVLIAAGGKELNIRAYTATEQMKEYSFRVTRIRCWRLTTSLQDKLNGCANTGNSSSSSFQNNGTTNMRFELSFEYLLSKDHLQWITIISDQAILMSVCLQGMVEELLMKRNGKKFKREDPSSYVNTGNRRGSWSYMKRDGSSHQITLSRSISTEAGFANPEHNKSLKSSQSHNGLSTKTRQFVENDAFDGIGDDDL